MTLIPYLVDCYLANAASALAAGTTSRSIFGCIFPLFTGQMYTNLGSPAASAIYASLAILLMPLPWIFLKYGERLRGRSRYAFN